MDTKPETPQPEFLTPGSSTLLLGPGGVGKTTAIVTFIEAGIETFVLITDPNGEEALLKAMKERDLDMNLLHWNYVPSASPSWDTLMAMATSIRDLSYKALTDIKSGLRKEDYQQFFNLLSVCRNFKCTRTGEEYGPVDSWGPNRAFILDSLSGMNTMCMDMTIGAKPIAHQGEWGVAMNAEEKIIKKFCSDLRCFFVLIAHIQRAYDEIVGQQQLMVDALGNKLAPKLPKDFSDVVLGVREGAKFFWSTTAMQVDLKARTLPLSDKLEPSFVQMVESWKEREATAKQEEVKGDDNDSNST
jgi:hypothetical protein